MCEHVKYSEGCSPDAEVLSNPALNLISLSDFLFTVSCLPAAQKLESRAAIQVAKNGPSHSQSKRDDEGSTELETTQHSQD